MLPSYLSWCYKLVVLSELWTEAILYRPAARSAPAKATQSTLLAEGLSKPKEGASQKDKPKKPRASRKKAQIAPNEKSGAEEGRKASAKSKPTDGGAFKGMFSNVQRRNRLEPL